MKPSYPGFGLFKRHPRPHCKSIFMITDYWIESIILAFTVSILITGILIPQIILIAFRKQLFDTPDERKIHQGIVPRLGGIAFFPAVAFSMAFVLGLNFRLDITELPLETWSDMIPFFFQLCALILIFLVGMADDLVGVRYRAKFMVQILSAILVVASGMYIDNLYGVLWLHELPAWLGWLVTGFVIVYIVNSINLIDGIDGLASGLSAIALIYYTIVLSTSGYYAYAMTAAAAAGTLVPFFYYNVFGNPQKRKKIFMGDTGSLTTGMILVFCGISVIYYDHPAIMADYNPVILAVSPLIIPAFDVVRVYFHRVKRHRNPFLPDKSHIHHKLLALGLSQGSALTIILSWSIVFIVSNVLLSTYANPNLLLGCDIAAWVVINDLLTRAIRRREARLGTTLYD